MRAYLDPQVVRRIAEDISNALRNSYDVSRGEPEIVKEFINRANTIALHDPTRVRAHFIHQKPMINFVSNFPNGRTRCELGDILFINKIVSQDNMVVHKSSLSQVKKSRDANNYSLKIPRHQLAFYTRPNHYRFRFGGKTWLLRPVSRWYAYFLSISHAEDFCFSFYTPLTPFWMRSPCVAGRYFEDFLNLFIGGRLGENLLRSGSLHDLVKEIYRFSGVSPDPPEEFEDNREEGGFGIIEFITTIEGKE